MSSAASPASSSDCSPPGRRAPLPRRVLVRVGAALLHRDFRILWIGAFTSTIGTWMQTVAKNWLVLDLTNSSFYLGLDAFMGELPLLLFMLLGGVVADRHDRRRLLMGSQYVQMACAFVLAALVYSGLVTIWFIVALSFIAGTAQAFGGPAYQSLIPALVPKRDLPNAIALNSIQFNLGRVIGPVIAGTTLAVLGRLVGQATGSAICFAINGLSFLAVIIGLRMLHGGQTTPGPRTQWLVELRGGIAYVRAHQTLGTLIVLASVATALGVPVLTFLPVIARDVFGGGVDVYSELLVVSGIGAVSGALVVAWLGRLPHLGRTMLVAQGVFATLLVAFSLSTHFWLSVALLLLASGSLMVAFSLLTSLVQLTAPDELRGRVMSIYMVAFRGGMPIGSLVAGYVATVTSVPVVLAVNGVLLLVVISWFAFRGDAITEL